MFYTQPLRPKHKCDTVLQEPTVQWEDSYVKGQSYKKVTYYC